MDITARATFLVSYDISNPRRLTRVRRVVLGFGDPVQLSVFRCDVTPQEMVELRRRLSAEIDARADQILFADLGPASGRGPKSISSMGRATERVEHKGVVV